MSKTVTLIKLKCPTCGAPLKAENSTDAITCVYCGNTVVPVSEANAPDTTAAQGSNVLRVEGLRTSSSALAYMEMFFEEYDWEAFAYSQTLALPELDKLTANLKNTSADDKNTWFACFRTIHTPFMRKISGCKYILDSVIEAYKNDNLDAYSQFDAYKRSVTTVVACKEEVIDKLTNILAKAERYGAEAAELQALNAELDELRNIADPEIYASIEDIPEIASFITEKNEKIAQSLSEKGINAQLSYDNAVKFIEQKNYVPALNILHRLEGYADSAELIEKADKYFLITNILEVAGKLYCFNPDKNDTRKLHPIEGKTFAGKPIVKKIQKIITNYGNILYFLDHKSRLKSYDLNTGIETRLRKEPISLKNLYPYKKTIYMLTSDSTGESNALMALDLASGTISTAMGNVEEIISVNNDKLVLKIRGAEKVNTAIFMMDTRKIVDLGSLQMQVEGFLDDAVVYTRCAPNQNNKYLYIKGFDTNSEDILIEKNIYKFCSIIGGKLFYYIGNSRNQTLVNINRDGTDRKEWPLYISKVLFEQGGWLYFIRRAGHNAVLCRAQLDGSKFRIIAADIENFITIKNGYLYYINDDSALVKVRMDGSNLQTLCDDVEQVLTVKEDKIIFVSIDDRISVTSDDATTSKAVKSIYAVDFTGSGKRKLVYDIVVAREYDEDSIYFIGKNWLQRLNVQTNEATPLAELNNLPEPVGCADLAGTVFWVIVGLLAMALGSAAEIAPIRILGYILIVASIVFGVTSWLIRLIKN